MKIRRRSARQLGSVMSLALLWLAVAQAAPPSSSDRAVEPTPEVPSVSGGPVAPSPLDPSARLGDGGSATEQWDLTALLDSGHHIVVRFMITNTGPGKHNAVVLGHVIRPDRSAHVFKKGRRSHRWTLSDDRRVLDVGSTDLHLREPRYRLAVSKSDVKIDLEFSPDVREATPPAATPAGYSLELLALSAPASGTLYLPEMSEPLAVRGHVALVHSWTSKPEGDVVQRRIDVHKLGPGPALYGVDLTTPQGSRTRWLLASEAGETLANTTEFDAILLGDIGDLDRRGYWVPSGIQMTGDGVSGGVGLQRTLVENDPLQALPGLIRWVVSLTMKPYRVWAESRIDVTLRAPFDDSPRHIIQGTGVTTLTFLNPLQRH